MVFSGEHQKQMGLAAEILRYAKMAPGFYALARAGSIADPAAHIRHQLAHRETNFLELVGSAVFSNPRNPYRRMLELAQCEYGDLEREVGRYGLERTLRGLLDSGVYVTQDEMKGRTPIIRAGETIPSDAQSFLNPRTAADLEARSSGSSGRSTRVPHSVSQQVHWERYNSLMADDLGLRNRAFIALLPILPSATGLTMSIRGRRFGWNGERWYAVGGTMRDSGHYRAVTRFMVVLSRLGGSHPLMPTWLPHNDFSGVAEYIARRRAEGVECWIGGFLSPTVRVASAALERGLDISGTIFSVGGEALSPAKRALLESTGGRVYPFYSTVDVGPVGYSCHRMTSGNCVHLFEDSVAAISRRRLAPLSGVEVNSLLFTTVAPYAARVAINVELDDCGIIEPAGCDCAFSRVGLTRRIREIASFGKVTGQGITLAGTDIVSILEEALPTLLGGGPGDYQLVEQEGPAQTLLVLRVSPRTGVADADRARECFLEELARREGGSLAARTFRHSGALVVTIAEPLTTMTGKVLPLHLLGAADERAFVTK